VRASVGNSFVCEKCKVLGNIKFTFPAKTMIIFVGNLGEKLNVKTHFAV
jgi:hypothetical protein